MREIIEKITDLKERQKIKNYIDFIEFPYFKNLETATNIKFDFPLTCFVGKNGCGKSSALKAIYGTPKGKSPSYFWFSTKVDPIEEVSEGSERHSFFYSFYKDDIECQVIKTRSKRAGDPDYWETSRPSKSKGMKYNSQEVKDLIDQERFSPIEKNVVYMDFKGSLGAFDKYFYFEKPKNLISKTKQDYLRVRMPYLNTKFNRVGEHLTVLTPEELEKVSYILKRTYIGGKIVKHNLFNGSEGISVYLVTENCEYSEANAGSGETAIVRMVHEILKAKEYSLILLDEPEVSLHPGAQKRLKMFLLEEIRKKKHQIIISTHSPTLISDLPGSAIKSFLQGEDGKFKVINTTHPKEAFYHLEEDFEKINVIVEDCVAKELLEKILIELGEGKANLFSINFYPGGAETIKTDFIKAYSKNGDNSKFFIFDGDKKTIPVPDFLEIESGNLEDLTYLSELFEEIIGVTVGKMKFGVDGRRGNGNEEQKKDLIKKYLELYKSNVDFLPKKIPEEIIWDDDFIRAYSRLFQIELPEQIFSTECCKKKILLASEFLRQTDSNLTEALINNFIATKSPEFGEICEVLNNFLNR